jgi:hypothetical protein
MEVTIHLGPKCPTYRERMPRTIEGIVYHHEHTHGVSVSVQFADRLLEDFSWKQRRKAPTPEPPKRRCNFFVPGGLPSLGKHAK